MDGVKILIAEPDRRLAETYAAALRARGCEVVIAHSSQDAIMAADKMAPDVVLLELQQTAHSGIEFLYEFRSYPDWQDVPVIVVSGVPPSEFAASRNLLSEKLGVVAYHYKPRTDLQALLHAVGNVV